MVSEQTCFSPQRRTLSALSLSTLCLAAATMIADSTRRDADPRVAESTRKTNQGEPNHPKRIAPPSPARPASSLDGGKVLLAALGVRLHGRIARLPARGAHFAVLLVKLQGLHQAHQSRARLLQREVRKVLLLPRPQRRQSLSPRLSSRRTQISTSSVGWTFPLAVAFLIHYSRLL